MADISKIIVDSLQYNIKDTNARDRAETLETNMARLDSNFSDLSDEVSEYESDVNALNALVQANTQDISTLQSNVYTKTEVETIRLSDKHVWNIMNHNGAFVLSNANLGKQVVRFLVYMTESDDVTKYALLGIAFDEDSAIIVNIILQDSDVSLIYNNVGTLRFSGYSGNYNYIIIG